MNKSAILTIIRNTAKLWNIDPNLAIAIAEHESSLNPNATNDTAGDASRGGSYGLFQLSLKTARGLGWMGDPKALLDPQTNATYGCKLLSQLSSRRGYTVRDIICAYNSGKPETSAPASTLTYLGVVLENYRALQAQSTATPVLSTAQPQ